MIPPRRTKFLRTPELVLLTALSAATHFWHVLTPDAVVFDEVYSVTMAGHYLAHTNYLDVHPPLARMLIAAEALLFHLDPQRLLTAQSAPLLRLLPALLGTLLVPLAYLILRRLGASRRVATLGGAFVLLDNALLVESRLLLPESFLIFFGLTALLAYLAARERCGAERWGRLALAALLAGCAMSVKWTGASALGVIAGAWLIESTIARLPIRRMLAEAALLLVLPIAVYLATYALHFTLLTRTGGTFDVPMSTRYQATFIGNPYYDPRVHLSFFEKLTELHRWMGRTNTGFIGATHYGSSPWYTWPIMKHPITYWVRDFLHPSSGIVILLGNPLVWWGALAASGAGVLLFVFRRARWAGQGYALAFLSAAYLVNFAPFAAIRRLMFLYHYLFALVLLAMLGALSLGVIAGWSGDDEARFGFASRRSAAGYWLLIGVLTVSFLYFSPFVYATPISPSSYDFHFWLLHPRF